MIFFKRFFARTLSHDQLREIQEINRLVAQEEWKLAHIKGNTALITNSSLVIKQKQEEVDLYKRVRDSLVSSRAQSLGFSEGVPVNIDLKTGVVEAADLAQPVAEQAS